MKKLLLILFIFISLNLVSAVERGVNSETIDIGDNIKQTTIYASPIFIDNEEGEYIPFSDVVNMSYVDSSIIYSYKTALREYNITAKLGFILDINEISCLSNGWSWFDSYNYCGVWADDAFNFLEEQNISYDVIIQDTNYGYKYAMNLTSIPSNYIDKIVFIGLRLEEVNGLTWEDVRLEDNSIIIKDKIQLSYQDLIDTGYTINLYDKQTLLIGNVTNKTELYLDPTVFQIWGQSYIWDAVVSNSSPNTNFDGEYLFIGNASYQYRTYLFFNLSNIDELYKIIDAEIQIFDSSYKEEATETYNLTIYGLLGDWKNSSGSNFLNESQITWNNQPCGENLNNDTNCNLTVVSSSSFLGNAIPSSFDVTNFVNDKSFLSNNRNVSFVLVDDNVTNNVGFLTFLSSEYTLFPALGTRIQITYITRAPEVVLKTPTNGASTSTITNNFICNSSSLYDDLTNATLYIWNSSDDINFTEIYYINGTTNVTTIEGNLTSGDGAYTWNCLVYNNITNSSWASTNFTINLETSSPAINLATPENGIYQNYNNVFFNYTAVDVNGVGECQLWGNWSGSWSKNYTWLAPENNTYNNTNISISEGKHSWSIFCNDSGNNGGFYASNYSFVVDTTNPDVNISAILTTPSSGNIVFNYSINDSYNVSSCFYSIYDSSGLVEGIYDNVSIGNCSDLTINGTATVGYGVFSLFLYANDTAGNTNYSNLSFITTNPTASSSGGVTVVASNYSWRIVTPSNGKIFDFYMEGGDMRDGDLYLYNVDAAGGQTISLECIDVMGDYCKYVNIDKQRVILLDSTTSAASTKFTIALPEGLIVNKSEFNIRATDPEGNRGEINVIIRKENIVITYAKLIFSGYNWLIWLGMIFAIFIINFIVMTMFTTKGSAGRFMRIPLSLVISFILGTIFIFIII